MARSQQKTNSRWREFSFALHQTQQAIEPALALRRIIDQWHTIAYDLAEPSRKRKPQVSCFSFN